MKHSLIRSYLTLALLLASIGISYADFDAGWAAYDRQDSGRNVTVNSERDISCPLNRPTTDSIAVFW